MTPAAYELGMKFQSSVARLGGRSALLQGRRQQRDAHRLALDVLRDTARHRYLHERDRQRLAVA